MNPSSRREFGLAVLVLVAGAALALLASTQPWGSYARAVPDQVAADLAGGTVAPAARALALVGLAGPVVLFATRGWARRIIGLLLALAGLGLAATSLFVRFTSYAFPGSDAAVLPDRTAWPWLSLVGGLLVAVGGVWSLVRSAGWPTMGTRFESPASSASGASPASGGRADDAWAALDRGEDPTDRA